MIQYNPLYKQNGDANGALVSAPSASVVFDLPGKVIWAKGVKFKGTDHTYTFRHDNYITITPTSGSDEATDVEIGVNITNLLTQLDKVRLYVGEDTNNAASAAVSNPYIKLFYNGTRRLTFRILSADSNLSVTSDANGNIIIKNEKPDINHNTDYRVSQILTSNDEDFRVLLKNSALDVSETATVKFSSGLLYNPVQKYLKIDGNTILHSGNYLNYTLEFSKILAQLKGEIHSFNYEVNTLLVNANIISAVNLYSENILLNGNQVIHTGNISHTPVTLTNWDTEYIIATIAGINIKVRTPINPTYSLETKNLKVNGINYAIYTTENTLPQFLAPTELGTNGQILSTDGSIFLWINCPVTNVTTSAVLASSSDGITHITEAQVNPYYNLLEGGIVSRSIQFLAGTGINISATVDGKIVIANTATDVDEKVRQIITSDNFDFRILLKSTANNNEENTFSKFASTLTYNPNDKKLKVDGNEVIHSGNYLIYTDEITKILTEIRGSIHNYEQFFDTAVLGVTNAYIQNLTVSEIAIINGNVVANSFIKNGGTSNQFLKADGSIDSTAYLPLTGGTLTGNITAPAFIITGGLSTQFLKADGTLDDTTYVDLTTYQFDLLNLSIVLASIFLSIKNYTDYIDSPILGVETIYSQYIFENGINISDKYLFNTGDNGSEITINNLLNNLTTTSIITDASLLPIYNNSWNKVTASNIWEYINNKWESSNPNLLEIEDLEGTGYLVKDTNWRFESFDNISKVLSELKASINSVNTKIQELNTDNFGITNAYIQDLIVSGFTTFKSVPLVNGTAVLLASNSMYLGTTSVAFNRGNSPLKITDVELLATNTASSADHALLLNLSSTSNVWIYWDSQSSTSSSPWGILSNFSGSSIDFVRNGTATASISLANGSITGQAFIKAGGTSSLFLKADGSVDSNTYITQETFTEFDNNVSRILNTIQGSIHNLYLNLDTSVLGITNAYIENLIGVSGNFRTSLQVNGVNVSLSGHTHDDRYYTETETNNLFVYKAGDTMTGNLTVPSLFVNTGDATLKIYSGRTTDAVSDGHIGLQTCIDGQDGLTSSYASTYQAREVLALQPRGGQVYIGTMPNGGNVNYKLYVNGSIFGTSFVKNGGTSSQFLKADGSIDSTTYLNINDYNVDLSNLTRILNTLQGSINGVSNRLRNLDLSNIETLGGTNAYLQYIYSNTITITGDINIAGGAYYTSDIRKKFDFKYISKEELEIFNNSDGYLKSFKWKDNEELSFGVIAQEIKEFAPEAVQEGEDGYLHVNYNVALSKIVGAMFMKMRELEKIINELKNIIKNDNNLYK